MRKTRVKHGDTRDLEDGLFVAYGEGEEEYRATNWEDVIQ